MQCIIIKRNVIIPNSAKVQLNQDSLCYLKQTLNLLGRCDITPKNRRFLAGQTPVVTLLEDTKKVDNEGYSGWCFFSW